MSVPTGLAWSGIAAAQNRSVNQGLKQAERFKAAGEMVQGLYVAPEGGQSSGGTPQFPSPTQGLIPVADLAKYDVTYDDPVALVVVLVGVTDPQVVATLEGLLDDTNGVTAMISFKSQIYGSAEGPGLALRQLANMPTVSAAAKV